MHPVEPPRIDGRRASDVKRQLRRMAPGYTPEWPAAADDDPGVALVDAFAVLAEGVIQQLNQAPRRNFIEFLNMLGVRLTPAQPAQAPVHFQLSTGLAVPVLVRARTRCSAPPAPPRAEDLPFESVEDLWAVPAALLALVSVDPERDAIYLPPPGFLALREAARPLPPYTTVSFTAAGSATLQLDRVEGLEPGDLLRVAVPGAGSAGDSLDCTLHGPAEGGRPRNLYLEVKDRANGRIVPLLDAVGADLPAGTRVEKVTRFALFDSRNLQEHVLYLGHADLLNVKSEARFTVRIDPIDPGASLPGFGVAWEYAVKAASGKGVDWRAFDVLADTSAGFGHAGAVELRKPDGEIAEAEIAGQKSRWIRARVRGPIPAVPRPRVPRLERVRLRVASGGGAGIPPDQTFHNDTPLQLPDIHPFGAEPRQFDRFYVASQEVFSKKGALVTLSITLKREGVTGPPAAALVGDTLHVFTRNPFGRLSQLIIRTDVTPDPKPNWVPHPPISRTTLLASGSRPAVASHGENTLVVFVRADDGKLYARLPLDGSRPWKELGAPPRAPVVYDPAAAFIRNTKLLVFAVALDRQLYSLAVEPASGEPIGTWNPEPRLPAGIASSPTVIEDGSEIRVYVADANGAVRELAGGTWNEVKAGDGAPDVVRADERVGTAQERPDLPSRVAVFAQGYHESANLVPLLAFVDEAGHLIELEYDPGPPRPTWKRRDLNQEITAGTPGNPLVSAAGGIYLNPGSDPAGRHLFVRDDAGGLWEVTDHRWRHPDRPVGRSLRADPAAIRVTPDPGAAPDFLSVFSATESHFLVEYRQDRISGRSGVLAGGPEMTLVLERAGASTSRDYTRKVVLVTAGPGASQHRVVTAHGTADRVLKLDRPWMPVPDATSRYAIVDAVTQGIAGTATPNRLSISRPGPGKVVRMGDLICIDDGTNAVVRRLTTGLGSTSDEVEFAPGWQPSPTMPRYAVVSAVTSGTGSNATRTTLRLQGSAHGAGSVTSGHLILLDDGVSRVVVRAVESRSGDEVTFTPPWEDPSPAPNYVVFAAVEKGQVNPATARAVVLGASAMRDDDLYKGAMLRIVEGTAAGKGARIASYSGAPQVAILESALDTAPDTTSVYEIEGFADWLQYEDEDRQDLQPDLSWEYWNGRGWLRLDVKEDTTGDLLSSGVIRFRLPPGIEQTEVAGQENFWIRARLVGGDYGRETFVTTAPSASRAAEEGTIALQSSKDSIVPPVVSDLTIAYQLDEDLYPRHCVTLNNLSFLDETAACLTPGKHFEPFQPLEDTRRALYLGFERPLRGGPIRILFAADERPVDDDARPRMTWSFRAENEWKALPADDRTEALVRQGLLNLQVPEGFQLRSLFGRSLYWLRGSLGEGRYADGEEPCLRGVFPNAVDTIQAATVVDEILGSSTGEPRQEMAFLTAPPGEPRPDWSLVGDPEIRVREVLSAEERAALEAASGTRAVVTLTVLGEEQAWVLWTEVDHFFRSTPASRHYRLDRARGRVRFGDGRRGMIPPAGTDNVRVFSYQAGGGAAGNVAAGGIRTLVTAVAGVDSVRNPVEAGGGGDVATVDEMLVRGPAQISHRGRAVTPRDFEWHAREASGTVAKARCLASTDAQGRARPGWVTVYVVPRSADDLPVPSLELRRAVARHLERVSEAGLPPEGRIAVQPPRYVPVSVEADVFARSLDQVAAVEQRVNETLRDFLHPLRGGPRGEGWDFGRPVAVSDLFVVLEALEGVDHVENLRLRFAGEASAERARVGRDELVAWAEPRIRMQFV